MGDVVVRRINSTSDRFNDELSESSDPQIRGIVNEFGFDLARAAHQSKVQDTRKLDGDVRAQAMQAAYKKIARYERKEIDAFAFLTVKEVAEADSIGMSILELVDYLPPTGPTIFSPTFRGCGFVDSCQGDLLDGRYLCELKAGDRNFRITDLRQLLTYAALNHLAPVQPVTHLALVNPRKGVIYTDTFDAIAWAASGRSASDLVNAIVDVMSGSGGSR